MGGAVPFKYRAFLSYSHRDAAWGKWLHRALEGYRIDRDLVGRQTSAGAVPKTLRPIFRDRDDFSAGHSLNRQTLAALEASQFLVVLCSPNSAASKYVNEEIRSFKALGRADRVLALIVDGVPGDPVRECFPPALRFKVGPDGALSDASDEPIAADAQDAGDGKHLALQKMVAGLLGLPLDDIVRRAERARKRQARVRNGIVATLLALTIMSAAGFAWARYELSRNEALLDRTLQRATGLVNRAVTMSESYSIPRLLSLGVLEEAESLFRDMAELGRDTPQLRYRKAQMLIAFARNYAVLGNTTAQRTRAAEAQALMQQLVAADGSPEFRHVLAATHNEIGDVQLAQGELQAALASYQQSLAIVSRLADSDPGNTSWQRFLLVVHIKLGDVEIRRGGLAAALQSYRDSLARAERLIRTDESNVGWQGDLAVAHLKLGDAQMRQGDLPAALQSYRSSLSIRERRASSAPNNATWQYELGISNERVGGVLLMQGDATAALRSFQTRHEIVSRLTVADSKHTGWQRDLSVSFGKLGEALLAQGNSSAALQSFRDGLAVVERLAMADPKNASWQRDLAVAHHKIGDVQARLRDLPAAIQSYRAGLTISERLAKSDPGNAQWQADLVASNAKLAMIGDDPSKRWRLVVETLRKLKAENKLTAEQEKWLPEAERRLAELSK